MALALQSPSHGCTQFSQVRERFCWVLKGCGGTIASFGSSPHPDLTLSVAVRTCVCTLCLFCSFSPAVGMLLMAAAGVFEVKRVSKTKALPVAAVYVGTIVLNNLSIKLNTVGFYQISKVSAAGLH